MMRGPRKAGEEIPREQAAIVGANLRALRRDRGRTQTQLGQLMEWPTNSTVCAAEGRRDGRQRGFTTDEAPNDASGRSALRDQEGLAADVPRRWAENYPEPVTPK